MKNIQELLAGRRIGVISAHPDDHLIHVHGIMTAHAAGAKIRELTLAKGRRSTINYHPDPQFVADGRRDSEGQAAASYLGIVSNDHLDAPDGDLANHHTELVPIVAEWISRHGIDLLMTLGGVTDHPDHLASAHIAKKAGIQLWDDEAYTVGVLEVQQADTGLWQARATTEGQATAFGSAKQHISQMRIAGSAQPGWEEVPGGLWAHPGTMQGLDQYPIRRSATYHWLPPGMLSEQVIIEHAAGPQ